MFNGIIESFLLISFKNQESARGISKTLHSHFKFYMSVFPIDRLYVRIPMINITLSINANIMPNLKEINFQTIIKVTIGTFCLFQDFLISIPICSRHALQLSSSYYHY